MSFVAIALFPAIIAAHGPRPTPDDCKYSAERNADLEAAGVRLFDIEAGAGSLRVEGKPGLTKITIRGHACASSKEELERIKLETRREGSTWRVRANIQEGDHDDYRWGEHYERLDVVVEVPAGMAANIADGSGGMELLNLGDVDVEDGSGEIYAEHIGGARIEDGSGEIELVNVGGNVRISDGSGEVTIRDVKGSVTVRDGSGSIGVRKVSGDFVVSSDGSGSIDYDEVSGRVDLPSKYKRSHRRDY